MLLPINLSIKLLRYFLLSLLLLCTQSVFAKDSKVYIENINLKKQGLIIKFSGKAAFQTVQVDDSQILIAFKGILSKSIFNEKVKKTGIIKKISFDKMAGDVTAMVVYTNSGIKSCNSKWLENENSLSVNFINI